MRSLALASLLTIFGCASNSLPIDSQSTTSTGGTNGTTAGSTTAGSTTAGTTTAGSTTAGTTTAGSTTAGSTTNGGTNGGGTTTGGGPGAMCDTACDCMSGLACYMSQCVQAPMISVYCCDDANTCPSGGVCQSSAGMYGMCGGSGGTTIGGNNGGIGGTSGTTGGNCSSACDCPTGQACFMGNCVQPPMFSVYCCDDTANCPSGSYCQPSGGGGGIQMCGGGSGMTGGTTGGTTGTTDMCRMTACKSDADCKPVGCARCSTRSNTCRIM